MATPVTPAQQSAISRRHEAVYQQLSPADEPVATVTPQPAIVPPPVQPPTPLPLANTERIEAVSEPTGEQPKSTEPAAPAPEPQPLIFNKYKSLDEAEKAYKEAERKMHLEAQQRAELQKQLEAIKPYVDVNRLTEAQAKTAVETAVQQPDLLELLASNPAKFMQEVTQQVSGAVNVINRVQQVESEWRKANPDLLQDEHLVEAEVRRIAKESPELVGDVGQLLQKATESYRARLQRAFVSGKTETQQMQTEAKGLQLSQVPQSNERGTPSQPPVQPTGETFEDVIARRRAEVTRNMAGYSGGIGPLRPGLGTR